MTLSYHVILKNSDFFERLPNSFNNEWIHAKKFIDWQNLSELSDKEVKDRVLKFLNQWSSHIPKTNEVVKGIKAAHKELKPYLIELINENLWDSNFNKQIMINNENITIEKAIYVTFKKFRDIGFKLREVASSKLLHQINPNLFIMWDNKIMKAYQIKGSEYSYVYEFLPLMQELLNEVIISYMEENNVNRNEAIFKLNNIKKYKTMVKLLDEYNWINYTYFNRTR